MGWTSYHIDGVIDRKRECDAIYNGEDSRCVWEVLKSTMRGGTYYAAVRRTDKSTGEKRVFAGICRTSVDNSDYYNFAYKDMSEDVGPCESKCPMSILKLLSETDNEYALDWRERCRAYNERPSLGRLPVGTVIEFEMGGQTYRAQKHPPAYQFKSPFWRLGEGYIKKKHIPGDFRVVQ